ncbi:hypothetical protein ACMYR3_05995 [Ampullimonas aquatilis]|uniref:hypothetical protein n=1 Tax=Ampullimonas aquatilis TaxID=1341549 RepID=UPI003C76EF07
MIKFYVWHPDNGGTRDDAKIFTAFNAEDAVNQWADWSDSASADYSIVGGQDATVFCQKESGGEAQKFLVQGRLQRAYYSHLIQEK